MVEAACRQGLRAELPRAAGRATPWRVDGCSRPQRIPYWPL